MLILIAIALSIIAYYMIVDIQSKVPKEIEKNCKITTEQFMGRNIFIITPKNKEKTNIKILYFHGGSYVAEATRKHWKFIEQLANDTGATVILPDYPLTPKYTYKDVFKMVVPLYKEIIEKVDTKNLILMGDSAGAGLGLALEEKIGLNKDTLKIAGVAYAGEDGIDNHLVNPIDGELSKLKNIIILTGTYDILNPDVHKLKEKAEKENVGNEITIKEYEQANHIWIIEKNNSQELIEKGYKDIIEQILN